MNLTPTQDLFLEVLAARTRLGERVWTFDIRHRRTARWLAEDGLIGWKSGNIEHTILAWLTDAGRAEVLSDTYQPPALANVETVVAPWPPGPRKGDVLRALRSE